MLLIIHDLPIFCYKVLHYNVPLLYYYILIYPNCTAVYNNLLHDIALLFLQYYTYILYAIGQLLPTVLDMQPRKTVAVFSGKLCGPALCSDWRLSSLSRPAAGFATSPVLQSHPASGRCASDEDDAAAV